MNHVEMRRRSRGLPWLSLTLNGTLFAACLIVAVFHSATRVLSEAMLGAEDEWALGTTSLVAVTIASFAFLAFIGTWITALALAKPQSADPAPVDLKPLDF